MPMPKRILIVADDSAASAFAQQIAAAGMQVVGHSRVGDGALAAIEAAEPDAVLVDMEWPLQEPLNVVGRIREAREGLPIVAASSLPRGRDLAEAVDSSLLAVIEKPLQSARLRSVLMELWSADRGGPAQ